MTDKKMKESLKRAAVHAACALDDSRKAYTAAVESGDDFAAEYLLLVITQACSLEAMLNRAVEAVR